MWTSFSPNQDSSSSTPSPQQLGHRASSEAVWSDYSLDLIFAQLMKSHVLNAIVFVCWRETHYWPPLVLVQYRLHQSNWDLVKKKSWRPEDNFLKVSHAPGCVTPNKSFLLRSRSLQLSTFAGNLSSKKTGWRVKKSSSSYSLTHNHQNQNHHNQLDQIH